MTDNPHPLWRQKACEWCKRGAPRLDKHWVHKVYPMNAGYGAFKDPSIVGPLSEYRPCTAPTESAYIAELEAKVAELTKENEAAEDQLAAFSQKIDMLSAPLSTCGCSYDHPAHVCMVHSPQLTAANTRIAELERDKALVDWIEREKVNIIYDIRSSTYKVAFHVAQGEFVSDCGSLRGAVYSAMNQTAQGEVKPNV